MPRFKDPFFEFVSWNYRNSIFNSKKNRRAFTEPFRNSSSPSIGPTQGGGRRGNDNSRFASGYQMIGPGADAKPPGVSRLRNIKDMYNAMKGGYQSIPKYGRGSKSERKKDTIYRQQYSHDHEATMRLMLPKEYANWDRYRAMINDPYPRGAPGWGE